MNALYGFMNESDVHVHEALDAECFV